jgi:hypothetical protein
MHACSVFGNTCCSKPETKPNIKPTTEFQEFQKDLMLQQLHGRSWSARLKTFLVSKNIRHFLVVGGRSHRSLSL